MSFGIAHRWYIPEGRAAPCAATFVQRVLNGEYFGTGSFSGRDLLRLALKRPPCILVKFCRANRFLPWLAHRFPTRPPVLIVRHPCAVVSSQMRHGAWKPRKRELWRDRKPTPYGGLYDKYADILMSIETWEEQLAATWCLDQVVPLRHPGNDRSWITVSYEELLQNGEETMQRIFGRLRISSPSNLSDVLKRPSRTTVRGSAVFSAGSQLSAWRRHLEPSQVRRILDVVDRFGLTDIYDDSLEPCYERISSRWAAPA